MKARTLDATEREERAKRDTPMETILGLHYRHWQGGRVVRSTPHYAATGELLEPWPWWEDQHEEV